VFLVGLHEGMLPSIQAKTPKEVEEERRLLYVGMTRAAVGLSLSWSLSRTPGGAARRRPSRFLDGVRPVSSSGRDGVDAPGRGSRTRASAKVPRCRVCSTPLTDPAERRLGRCRDCPSNLDEELFERLKAWRLDTARALKQPAFVIFTDAALTAIAERKPTDDAGMLAIPGVGAHKLEKFGADIIAICAG
jgi:DNA helicase-2/ATP-dependent DNA helicase PcrA